MSFKRVEVMRVVLAAMARTTMGILCLSPLQTPCFGYSSTFGLAYRFALMCLLEADCLFQLCYIAHEDGYIC